MDLLKLFKRKKKNASPYYGGNDQLFRNTAMPIRREEPMPEPEPEPQPKPVPRCATARITSAEWEDRRYELVKMLVCQDRRSVVLGKLSATNKQIAYNARILADAAIKELQNHPYRSHDEGEKTDE